MTDYILAIDQGTTSSRATLFEGDASLASHPAGRHLAQIEFSQYFPADGWVEHDPEQLWQSVLDCCRQLLDTLDLQRDRVLAMGITNQRETTLVWDRHTGVPLGPAIVWQDRRTSDQCQRLQASAADLKRLVQTKTGLRLDPYFSATKLQWMLDHYPGARSRAEQGDLLFGTVDSFLIWRLTGGQRHVTDASNASRTLLFNIHTQQWDAELLALFNIPRRMLPEVLDSAADFGCTDPALFGRPIPIRGVAGDQQAALFAHACFQPGMGKCTYGTGAFMMMNTGSQAPVSDQQLLTTVAWRLAGEVCYALEGSIFIAGAVIQWLRDELHLLDSAAASEALAASCSRDHGVWLVPAFTGLGAPYWDPTARGAIFGLTRDTGSKELVTAGLESVAYQSRDLLLAMQGDGLHPDLLRVDGGMTANRWFVQFLTDMLGIKVQCAPSSEATALGAALLAALQIGIFTSLSEIAERPQPGQTVTPAMTDAERQQRYRQWQAVVAKTRYQPT